MNTKGLFRNRGSVQETTIVGLEHRPQNNHRTTIVGLADNHLQSISGVRQNEIHPYRQAIGHPYRPSTAHHNANDISYITRSKANINLIILQKM